MTQLTGIHDGEYLAQFLGKKIAIRSETLKNRYYIFPNLSAVFAGGVVQVTDSNGDVFTFSWEQCENPYVILQSDVEIVLK